MIVCKRYSDAAGIFPYTVYNDKIYFLVGYERRGYSDFGGYRESIDESTLECACREFSEETLGCFSINKYSRGTVNGVIETTMILNKILNNKELHMSRLVNKVFNSKNRYEMFICPVNRFLRRNEFKSTYNFNRNQPIANQIECAEKKDIYWLDIDSIIVSVETNNPQIRCNRGHIFNLYSSFFNTLKDQSCVEHLKFLRSTYQKDPNLLYSLISDIYSSPLISKNLPPPSLNKVIVIDDDDDDDDDNSNNNNNNNKITNDAMTTTTTTTTTATAKTTSNIQPNIKKIQQTLFDKFK
ncbi:hypothetical protein RB653_004405 [Dictyostelium firmibasis]|uniref:Nudix hydrolase domain-containing protein n=1 Tax=Dictyostelium firmibasis TaxID=79012 RepID=A0AAN7U626_9MYCE